MLTNETISKLNEMHLGTMAAGFTAQLTDPQFQSLSFEERFSILVDAEWSARKSNRLAKLITGEKWSKELYDETVETIGKDLIAKYIVDGEFLVEKLEADIAACGENKQCLIAYEEARNAFCRFAVNEAVKTLEGKNINYEIRNETGLVFFITADEFASLHLDNVSHFGFASKDGDGMDFVEESTDD